jgi:translation initiation factor 1
MLKNKSKLVYSTEGAVPRKDKPVKQQAGIAVPPAQQQVYIRLEKKGRGGKSVSVIAGLQLSRQDLEKLLKQLKTRLGTGGTVKDNTLEIQGDHRDALCTLFQDMGYRPKRAGG